MSRAKEAQRREQDNLMDYYIRFYEWLDSLNNELYEDDISCMDKYQKMPTVCVDETANNDNYKPTKGEIK